MDWEIGELKQINGEWYQCIKGSSCDKCDFLKSNCIDNPEIKCSYDDRKDGTSVVFKKLEKVGVPYHNSEKKLCQQYKCYINPLVTDEIVYVFADNRVVIEIKQNKEDMEEKKLNLKPFDLQKAREGKPVCTRDGRKARIICFDAKCNFPIIALITQSAGDESLVIYNSDGRFTNKNESDHDLMMLPEKKEGWAVIRKGDIYETEELAKKELLDSHTAMMIKKISWEE